MQQASSWDRSGQAQASAHNPHRAHPETTAEDEMDLCRRILARSLPRDSGADIVQGSRRLDQDHRALALVGITLRPRLDPSPPVQPSSLSLRTRNKPSSIALADLPTELLMMFLDYLDWESLTTLRLTSKFFATLVLSANLQNHYLRCLNETAKEEELLVKEGSNRYTSRGAPAIMYGQDLRAQAMVGDMNRLPCYRCLRWFRCPPRQYNGLIHSRKSVFSDWMGRSKDRDGVWRYLTRSRLCYECGIKKGYYVRGSQFKRWMICMRCSKLGKDLLNLRDPSEVGGSQTRQVRRGNLRNYHFCRACVESNEIPQSYAEYVHQYGKEYKYEKAMWKKREACRAKRKELGRERLDESNRWEVWCPIIKRKSICSCGKDEEKWRERFSAKEW